MVAVDHSTTSVPASICHAQNRNRHRQYNYSWGSMFKALASGLFTPWWGPALR
jgi:hypothetical protein